MMLGVKGHVPHEQTDDWVGQRGSRIRQPILIGRASGVFGDQDGSQQRLG